MHRTREELEGMPLMALGGEEIAARARKDKAAFELMVTIETTEDTDVMPLVRRYRAEHAYWLLVNEVIYSRERRG